MADSSKSVNIYARLRKIMPWEDPSLSATAIDSRTILNRTSKREQAYQFTHVFTPSDDNIKCFNALGKPLLSNVLSGYNAILMAYGQTGSGKTYSILGKINQSLHQNNSIQHEEVKGLLTLSLEYLLCEPNVKSLQLSAIETFGHHIQKIRSFDLADNINEIESWDKKQPMKSTSNIKKNATKILLNKLNIQSTINKLHKSSHFAPTGKNPQSSRGHIVYVTSVQLKNNITSYWIVVDLAGSEGESAITKEFLKNAAPNEVMARRLEAWCINHGLSQLQVIFNELRGLKKKGASLGTGLKKTLSEFMDNNSYISVLFTISPSSDNNKSTEATLRFAESAALVKCTPIKQEKKINKDNLIIELKEFIEKQKQIIIEKNNHIAELENTINENNNNEEEIYNNIREKYKEFEQSIDEEKHKQDIWKATKSQFLSFEDEEELEQSMRDQMSDIRRASRVSADIEIITQILGGINENNNDEIFNHIKHSSITSIRSNNMHTIIETDDEYIHDDMMVINDINTFRINKILNDYKNGYELHMKSLQGLNKNELLYLCTQLSENSNGNKVINETDKIIESHEKQIQFLTNELNKLQKYHKHSHSLSLESDIGMDVKIFLDGDNNDNKQYREKDINNVTNINTNMIVNKINGNKGHDQSPSSSRIDPMDASNLENMRFINNNNNNKQINIINVLDNEDDEKMVEDNHKVKSSCIDNCVIL